MHVWVVMTSTNLLINVQSGFLPPECLWQCCCVGSVLPVWTEGERAFHTRSSFTSLAAIVWEINFRVASQLQYMGKKRVAFDTSCLRWAGYTAAIFFFNLTVHLRVTVIVRVVSLRLADEKITAADIQMVSLLKLLFMAQAPITSL